MEGVKKFSNLIMYIRKRIVISMQTLVTFCDDVGETQVHEKIHFQDKCL